MTNDIEPLHPLLWFRQIEKVACGRFKTIEHSLRHASHLLQLTPMAFREVVRLAIPEERFEAMLEAGNFDSAARHLIAQPAALAVEEGVDGIGARATISCAILGRAIHGSGTSVGAAVLDAWTTCLLALRDEAASAPAQ